MARESGTDESVIAQLAHPVYLDTPMLVSFLASLEDGVRYSSEVAERYSAAKEGEGEGSGKISIPSIATLLGLNLSAEGRYRRRSSKDEGVESKFVREHTAASLFNRLRVRLAELPGAIRPIDSPKAFESIDYSGLVEIRGEITGNPLKQLLDFFATIGPYLGVDIEDPVADAVPPKQRTPRSAKGGGKGRTPVPQLASTSGEQTPELSMEEMLRVLKREVERSLVLDLLMEGPEGTKAILTVSRDLLSPEVEAYLVGGKFTVLAKVSAVLGEGQSISLLRRTVFGFGGREFADSMVHDFNEAMSNSDGLDLSLGNAIVDGPVVQLLPLAIYL